MKQRLVVIGNGMAGIRIVEELLAIVPEKYEITVFGSEPYGNYNRIMLSSVLSGKKNIEHIVINDRQWYVEHKPVLKKDERLALLTGKPPLGTQDIGPIVCSCFNVGEKTIQAAI